MFDLEAYMSAIGFTGPAHTEPRTLRKLQRLHLMAIPYNNARTVEQSASASASATVGAGAGVGADLDAMFETVVLQRGGGVCFELNVLFRRLLEELGFQVEYLSAGVRGPGGGFGPDLEHLLLGVRLTGTLWLVDVGFAGPGYLEPVRVGEGVQSQNGCDYRVVRQDPYYVVERRAKGEGWRAVYRLLDRPRTLDDWLAAASERADDDAWNPDGEPTAAPVVIRSRALENGQMVLVGRRLLTVEDGHERIGVLAKAPDYDQAVELIMGEGAR